MHGFGSHTFSWLNAGGERYWVKYHFKTVQGIETFTDAEAEAMTAEDPDFHRRDLRAAIDKGDAPEWRLNVQLMPFADAANYRFNPFDLTKVWPHGDYPEIEVGRLVLDRNPDNFFAEVEQAGFSPANLVPGIGLSPDKMLMGRIFSYHDTHLHRIGANYEQLPINAPKVPVHSYNKDAPMTYHHSGAQPVYAPNSYGGPQADPERGSDLFWEVPGGELGRYAYEKHSDDDDFGQAGTLYRQVMNDTDREHLAANIVGHASNEVSEKIQMRVIAYWSSVDPELGARVAAGLGHGGGNGDGSPAAAGSGNGYVAAQELLAARANRA
jgi:catalase